MTPHEEKQRDKLIYEMIVNRYDLEWRRTNDIDSKASSVIGFAGLLATVLATLTAGITVIFPHARYGWLFLLPLGLFVVSAGFGLWGYWMSKFITINPINLIEEYQNRTEEELIQRVAATTAEDTMKNYKFNQRKAVWVYVAFIFLIIAISLFLVVAILNLIM